MERSSRMMMKLRSNSSCEAYGRLVATLVLGLTASLIGSNRETKVIFQVITKTADYQSIGVFEIQMYVSTVAAAYNLIQLISCVSFLYQPKQYSANGTLLLRWVTFIFDQVVAYIVLGTTCASTVASMLALTGNTELQWGKLCHMYTRFCYQVGGHLLCAFVGSIVMASLSSLSAYNIFRLYSPHNFLRLKTRPLKPDNISSSPTNPTD